MPTVIALDGFTIKIRLPPREHGPPHVHVFKAGEVVVIELAPVRVRDDSGMREDLKATAVRRVKANQEFLLERWRQLHG